MPVLPIGELPPTGSAPRFRTTAPGLTLIDGPALERASVGCLHPDDRYLASAAEQTNASLSAAGRRQQARRSDSLATRL